MTHLSWTPSRFLLLSMVALGMAAGGCGRNPDSTAREGDSRRAEAPADSGHAARCAAHGAPASRCFLCDAALRDPARLWCGEHGRYEDRCFICHPELRDAARLYCEEHGLYEDECFICHPDLSGSDPSPAAEPASSQGGQGHELMCGEHGILEADCGICHPDLADGLDPGQGLKIRLPSESSAGMAGILSEPVAESEAAGFLEALGRLDFDRNRHARLAAPVDGLIQRVLVDLGETVPAGRVLVTMSSPEWADARATFLQASAEEEAALAAYRREEDLHARRVSSRRDFEEARARYEAARAARRAAEETLLGLGLPPEDLGALRDGTGGVHLSLRAPFAGTVVSREATVGELAARGVPLVTVSSLDPLWAILSVPAEAAIGLEPGLEVDVLVDGTQAATGRITWIAQALEASSRMVEIRVEVPNPGGRLRPGTFVSARIRAAETARAIRVPQEAVHRFGGRPFVFVELEKDLFEVRRVTLGGESGREAAVLAGLTAGDRVVMTRSFLVKSEFQKSRLGAGCVD